MSHTIIDALDRVIPSLAQPLPRSIVPTEETLNKYTNYLCASRGNFPHQKLLMPDYELTWSILERDSRVQQRLRPDGSLLMGIMMHDDGFGSSRILLSGYLQQHFPAGYYVAIPDRRIGIVTPRNLSERERQEIQNLLQSYYDRASVPIGLQLLAPEDLLPQQYYWK